jgi:hypothetical protein
VRGLYPSCERVSLQVGHNELNRAESKNMGPGDVGIVTAGGVRRIIFAVMFSPASTLLRQPESPLNRSLAMPWRPDTRNLIGGGYSPLQEKVPGRR